MKPERNDRNNNVREPKYVISRLRNSGYRADMLIGNPDPNMRDEMLAEVVAQAFEENSSSSPAEIFTKLKAFRPQFSRSLSKVPDYSKRDSREWTIVIDSGNSNILLTFYRNYDDINSDWFELYDGNQYVQPWRVNVSTESFEILVEKLNNLGIVNKVETYPKVLLERIQKIRGISDKPSETV